MTGTLAAHEAAFHAVAARLLDGYVTTMSPGNSPKEFNDPVWGTVRLAAFEVAVLDSPLVQRLRRIRQLGVAHLVYPAATHTRLEHSLGVVQQVSRLAEAVNDSAREQPDGHDLLDEATVNSLRLTALVHDVGHGVMSHVSQNALDNVDSCRELLFDFGREHGLEDPKLSEVAAYFLLTSPSFAALVEKLQARFPKHQLRDNAGLFAARAVNGLSVDNRVPQLHELISGPYDADKLDYMTRDATMSGVPIVTDITRLTRKVRAVNRPLDELPAQLQRAVQKGESHYGVIGIARSGGRTLDELLIGRTLMFDKIYRHQKVRAAEVMVAAMLDELEELCEAPILRVVFDLDDEQLMSLDVPAVGRLEGLHQNAEQDVRAQLIANLARRLRERRLFVRALAFADQLPGDPYADTAEQQDGLQRLLLAAQEPEERGELVRLIADATTTLVGAMAPPEATASLVGSDLKPYLWIDPPHTTQSPGIAASDVARAYLVDADGAISGFEETQTGAGRWADAYLLTRDTGYLFAPAELAPYAYLAAERVVRERYGVRMPPTMTSYAKQDLAELRKRRIEAEAAGWYDGAPKDLRPTPDFFLRGDIDGRLQAIASAFTGYAGPLGDRTSPGQAAFGAERVRDWLRQFPAGLEEPALQMLEGVRLLGRADVDRAVRRFVQARPQFRGASLCPLGSPQDSSAVNSYWANDVAEELGLRPRTLLEALNDESPILFVDDLIGSGLQASNIVAGWLGRDAPGELGEIRDLTLSEPLRGRLRERELGFCFVGGLDHGVAAFEGYLAEQGVANARVGRDLSEQELPSLFDETVVPNPDTRERLLSFARGAGMQLLASHLRQEKREGRVLGYGDRALLIVFSYNTPSQTLVLLWADGHVDGQPWMPLFPRRKKR